MKEQTKKRPHSIVFNPEDAITKQSFKDECNINKIMAKFQRTGALSHYTTHAPQYGEVTQDGLMEAMAVVTQAETMFEELPSSIRKRFDNDPGQFLDFVQDETNREEMVKLGLADGRAEDSIRAARSRASDTPPTETQAEATAE